MEGEAPLLAGRRIPQSEVASLLRHAGFKESAVPQMLCAAKYESAYFARALHTNRNGSHDYGLFQINDRYWLDECGVQAEDLYDPATNVACAKIVYSHRGMKSWYGFVKHREECENYSLDDYP